MVIPQSKEDDNKKDDPLDKACPHYANENTPWWDGSQIYGGNEAATRKLRVEASDDGKLQLTSDKKASFLPRDKDGLPLTGFANNWWIGLELLHTLFALEHNAICDMFRQKYPAWTGLVQVVHPNRL